MRADLDRLYAALGTHADDLPLAGPGAVRSRGRQRSRGRYLVAAAATAILLGTATGVGWMMDRSGLPALQDRFAPLEAIGAGIPMPLDPTSETGSYGTASVVGERAFGAARAPDGHLRVGAIDLATGGPAWPTRDLGRWGDWMGMIALPQGVIVMGEHDDGSTPDHVAMVVDPASGTLRWQVGIDDLQFEYFDSVLVVLSSADRLIRGLDWQTGAERWRRPIDPGEGTRMLGNHSTGAVPAGRGLLGLATAPRDHRLLVIDPAGTLEVLDARTGDLIATHREVGEPVVGDSRSYYRAYDGMLYGFSSDTRPTRISAFDLDRPGRTRALYTVASGGGRITNATPCGPRRLCVISDGRSGADPGTIRTDIAVIDVGTGRVLWRRQTSNIFYASALGNRILTNNGQLYDRDGKQLLGAPHSGGGWVRTGTLLLLSQPDATGTGADVEVAAVSAKDGARMPLGRIPALAGSCSWSTTVLVCPTSEGFKAWRFATR